jgi:Flp pilus assembly pilin Flp
MLPTPTADRSEKPRTRPRRQVHAHAHRGRGATMVEYALLIIAIMFLAAIGYRNLGKTVKQNAVDSDTELKAR